MSQILKALFCFLLFGPCAIGQTIEIGSPADQYIRFLVLKGAVGDSLSFINKPYNLFVQRQLQDSTYLSLVRTPLYRQKKSSVLVGMLPLLWDQQYLSHHPFPTNDGAMIQAKGYQTKISSGIFGRLGPISGQLQPEIVWAANPDYPHRESYGSVPRGNYRKFYWGQSTGSLHFGPAAISVSTQNIWWGPGIHTSLMMTSQAPGFVHAKFHSFRPLNTPIGNFEWTILGGKLQSDSMLPFENNNLRFDVVSKPFLQRYLNAYVLAYQPSFLKGLHVGISRAMQLYSNALSQQGASFFSRYLPVVFKPIKKNNAVGEDTKIIDQLAAVYFRWSWSKSKAELYGEYGYNDYKANTRDFVLNTPHSAAYLLGFRKLFLNKRDIAWVGGFEITQLAQSADQLVRNAGNWYIHSEIKEGYTHQNQVLGAAFASNMQTIELVRFEKTQRSSFTFQRFQRDPGRNAAKWNDWVLGASHSQQFKGFYVTADVKGIFSRNYAWQSNSNPFQILAKAGIRYYFHD